MPGVSILKETVTRQIGDQSYTVTRKRDSSGKEETQENLVNIKQGIVINCSFILPVSLSYMYYQS